MPVVFAGPRGKFCREKPSGFGTFGATASMKWGVSRRSSRGTQIARPPALTRVEGQTLQVSSFGSFSPGVASSPGVSSSPGGVSSPAGQASSSSATAFDSSGNSVVQQFLDYSKMNPMERLRASILKSLGLT